MKVITIKEIEDPVPGHWKDDFSYYVVRLGNGKVCQFTQRRDADAFVVATSKYLTERLVELNELYIAIFAEYRRMWFYFDGRKGDNLSKMQKLERDCRAHIDQVQYCFDHIHRNKISGGNELPWKLIARAAKSIYRVSEQIIELRKRRADFVERLTIENLKKRSFFLLKDLSSYAGGRNYTHFPDNEITNILNSL